MNRKRTGIDEHLEKMSKYVGLAKEAATKAMPRADSDAHYFLALASKESGKEVDDTIRGQVWALFRKVQPERIKQVEKAIKRYEKDSSENARAQLEWYTKELARLKEWSPPRK